MNKKMGCILIGVLSLVLVVFVFDFVRKNTDNFGYFQRFSVTINNESDYDIVSVEMGIVSGTEKDYFSGKIKSGESLRIKPELSLAGEGAVYLKYTDGRGVIEETIACGYTESLSGKTRITIDNDGVTENEQKCL
ncbi:hypothetical protein [Paenibacillus sp. LHD-38]|uniref:hypothetical protein n=1 Tax=Paenibacillus sp. LHD-38 TaxID=3072143 RepID=UPI00280CC823|nr:hypothetical protein [Paenibacillus sp. LHD-38]MDQ8735253.1 hypothetical protein [Paenibacillus sp. LHD-38]